MFRTKLFSQQPATNTASRRRSECTATKHKKIRGLSINFHFNVSRHVPGARAGTPHRSVAQIQWYNVVFGVLLFALALIEFHHISICCMYYVVWFSLESATTIYDYTHKQTATEDRGHRSMPNDNVTVDAWLSAEWKMKRKKPQIGKNCLMRAHKRLCLSHFCCEFYTQILLKKLKWKSCNPITLGCVRVPTTFLIWFLMRSVFPLKKYYFYFPLWHRIFSNHLAQTDNKSFDKSKSLVWNEGDSRLFEFNSMRPALSICLCCSLYVSQSIERNKVERKKGKKTNTYRSTDIQHKCKILAVEKYTSRLL